MDALWLNAPIYDWLVLKWLISPKILWTFKHNALSELQTWLKLNLESVHWKKDQPNNLTGEFLSVRWENLSGSFCSSACCSGWVSSAGTPVSGIDPPPLSWRRRTRSVSSGPLWPEHKGKLLNSDFSYTMHTSHEGENLAAVPGSFQV